MTESAARSGGEILVDGLLRLGLSNFFCVPGESYLAVLDACYGRSDELRLVVCRQEGGAAYMAEAWGKLTGRPGVCFVTRGPGASNAMVGIHTAFQDSTPLLLFVGQVRRHETGREAFQELDYQRVYAAVAKQVIDIDRAERIPELLGRAYAMACSGRPGPVVVVLPEDMLRERAAVPDLAPASIARSAPRAEDMARFTALVDAARAPLVICGGAAWSVAASDWLTRLVERLGLPVASVFRRQDSFDNTHVNYVGDLGLVKDPGLLQRLAAADLLIVVGPRLGEITTSGYELIEVPGPAQKLVHVFCDAAELNRVYRADLAIVSDPGEFLRCAATAEYARGSGDTGLLSRAHAHYDAYVEEPRNVDAAVRMDQVMAWLRDRLGADAIITNGAGNYTTWPQRHYRFRRYPTQLAPTNGSMGYGVPAAIAAKLASPEQVVVSFAGDGCFLMNGQELATAVQYDVAVIILVINNSAYGTIRTHQQRDYPGRPMGTALANPDFVALAESYGAFARRVERTADFAAAFEQALDSGRAALIELITDY